MQPAEKLLKINNLKFTKLVKNNFDKGEVKLEVDATSGKIVEDKQSEIYQIGKE
jgi:uncharacterized membrane protein YkoI